MLSSPKIVSEALEMYQDQRNGWQSKWAEALKQISLELDQISELEPPQRWTLETVISMTADAVLDSSRGSRNPLVLPMKVGSRPVANSIEMTKRRALAVVAGMFVEIGRTEDYAAAEAYRRAARAIRRCGGDISWVQVRSAWVNRRRYTDAEIHFIDTAVRSVRGANLPFDPREVAMTFAKDAAALLKSKASIF